MNHPDECPQRCDLHLHSTHSDGALSVGELMLAAKAAGVRSLSLTDHDTLAGLAEAQSEALRLAMDFLPGVEISTRQDGQELHILGYGFRITDPALLNRLEEAQAARRARLPAMISKLAELGICFSPQEVQNLEMATSPGRPHLARLLVSRGSAASVDEVFERWLGQGKPAYVRRSCPTPNQAITWIHDAGGKAVWAHPLAVPIRSPGGFPVLARHLARMGLDGFEEIHPGHDAEARRNVRRMARELHLGLTGGSDFHQADHPSHMLGRGRDQEEIPEILAHWLLPPS